MSQPKQLSLAITLKDETRLSSFEVGGTNNAEALEHLSRFASVYADDRGVPRNLMLWGSEGAGLSHLLQAVCHDFLERGFYAQYLPLSTLINYDPESICDGLESADLVCIDDIHLCSQRVDWQRSLFHLFNALRDSGNCFVCASHASPTSLPIELPDLKSRLLSGTTFNISPLDELGLKQAFAHRALARGLDLSGDVVNYIFVRARRSTHDLFRLLDHLDQASLAEKRRVTIPFVKEILNQF